VAVPRPAAVSPPFLFFFVFWFFSFLFFLSFSSSSAFVFLFFALCSSLQKQPLHVTGRLPWPQTPSYWPAARSTSHSGGRDLRHLWLP